MTDWKPTEAEYWNNGSDDDTQIGIGWVGQEEPKGCGIACLAMITGRTYADVRQDFSEYFDGSGLDIHIMDEYLADKGFAVARKYESAHWAHKRYEQVRRDKYPCEPFADVHLVQLTISENNHFVVMLNDGTILDPMTPEPKRIEDYKQVWNIAGIKYMSA